MLFRRTRSKPSRTDPPARRIPDPFEDWRRCEKKVTRAWKAWQALGTRDEDGSRFHALMNALADEERAAAAVQRALLNSSSWGGGARRPSWNRPS